MNGVLVCFLLALFYVLAVTVWRRLPRSHPETVFRRTISALVVSSVSWLPVRWVAIETGDSTLDLLGLRVEGLLPALWLPLLCSSIAYIGPVLFAIQNGEFPFSPPPQWSKAIMYRNLIFAPLTEEWVFRACMVPLLPRQGLSPMATVFLCPLFFGVAHAHHLFELMHEENMKMYQAIQEVTFQFLYTTLFGWYSTFVFIRTGHILPCILIHSFCNMMGLPIDGRMFKSPQRNLWLLACVLGPLCLIFSTAILPGKEWYG